MAWLFMTGVLFSMTGTLNGVICHCNTACACACAVFPSTPCSQVGDPDRCQEGWFGSYCQKQNIALGRSATQSSTYSENSVKTGNTHQVFEARYGVDGRATNDFYSRPFTCTHTLGGDSTWTVFLNISNTDKIQHVKLYLRNTDQDRNNGMKIYVRGKLCFQWPRNTHPPDIADVKCQQALTGNNLAIRTSNIITLCEVQIFVCSDGWFDEDCDKQCHCSLNTEVCDKITGQCLSGCAPGYMGPDCQTECPDGYYGDCTSRCGNCLNATFCDKTTGICPGGCAAGWRTDTCLQPCPDGYYGPNCGFQCGSRVDGDVCIRTNGTCPRGCAAGWFSDRCNQQCADGMYGVDCMSRCGQCKDTLSCDKSSGECPEGCQGNFMKPLCQGCTECSATSGSSDQGVAVAATLGTLLALTAIALLAAIIYIYKKRK
ncbi:protein draper-like, partial [Haliotis rubra]|uniref:protein draper-like n=1 Tax=Haliotis rubra TaxID=36100 RepID=UPI001EE54167